MASKGKILSERNIKKSFTQRLQIANNTWKKLVEPVLKKQNRMIEVWTAGFHSKGDGKARPINLTDRGIGILVPYLVMSHPKVFINTRYNELRPYAYTMELALNFHAASTKLSSRTLRPAVLNAMIGMGIVKTGVMHKYDVEIFGATHHLGEVYSDVVNYSDYIGDPSARHRDGFELEGNRYCLPTEYAQEFFGPKHADSIKSSYKLWGDIKEEDVTKSHVPEDERFQLKEYTEFADFYIPDENIVLTIDPNASNPKILRTVEMDESIGNPYDVLSFKQIPGTPIPVPPVWGWLDMEDAINLVVCKMKKQAEEEKTVLAYQGAGDKDARRIAKSGDRTTVRVDDVKGVQLFEFPGINAGYYNWLQYLELQYSKGPTNLNTLGGRGAQAGTLGQEQMMMSNASRSVNDMMNSVYDFTHSIFQKRSFHMWEDPTVKIVVEKVITDKITVPALFSKTDRKGDFWKYSFEMVPYSMQRMGPDMEYQRLLTYLSQIAMPLAEAAASQGKQLNVDEITNMMARYMGIEEVDRIWKSVVPQNDLKMNPYNPQASGSKTTKPRGEDPRSGQQGEGSRQMNNIQQQTRTGGSDQVQM